MNKDETAVVPDSFEMPVLDAEPIEKTETIAVEDATANDRELAALNLSKGWQRIADEMKKDIDSLRNMTRADLNGLSREEVGDKFLVSSAVADRLQWYLEMVDNATKAVSEHERSGK